MKKILLFFVLFAFCKVNVWAQYPDLPGPGGNFNLQTLPTGSYVIAMDNINQASSNGNFVVVVNNRQFTYTSGNPVLTATTNTTGILVGMGVTGHASIPAGATVTVVTATTVTISLAPTSNQTNRSLDFGNTVFTGADFNLKAYGLLVTLLNNNVKLKWIIKPGKAKDANDFSVNATMIKPSLGSAANYNFAGGPFVIFQQDTAGVAALVQTFNGAASSDDVKLYKTNADVSVDVRYNYFINGVVWKPKAAILDDGGNAAIHESYMINASVPVGNYSIETTPNFVTNCYTFASEPHNDNAPAAVIQGIRTFVENGGNFLAECAAVRTYELSTLARFQSTNGFDNANENGIPASLTISNADLAYFQINGYFGIGDEGGSLKSWVIPESPGNPPTNNLHVHTSGNATVNGSSRPYTNASVSKLFPTNQLGGMVFYLGSHSYDGTDDFDINGQRMYLNAFLVPTNPQGSLLSSAVINCASWPTPVTVSCASSAGPTAAYPLTFTLYEDLLPVGYNVGDPQLGNVVTFTAPNTPQGGNSTITAPSIYNSSKNYVIAIRPNSGCLQPKYLQSFCSTLPVSLLSFTAVRSSALVNLKWKTASEQNNQGFSIERMLGNGMWETVGFVTSQAPGGNSSSELTYSFTDQNNFKGISQYRLRQADFDGKTKYSEIRSVRGENQGGQVIVYPNPSIDGKVNVSFENASVARDVAVMDMNGRMVRQLKGITTSSVTIESLMPGIYSVRVFVPSTGEQFVQKIVVSNK